MIRVRYDCRNGVSTVGAVGENVARRAGVVAAIFQILDVSLL